MSDDVEYMRTYMAKRYTKRREAELSRLGGKCIKCGDTESLHFHHKEPEKKTFGIGCRLAGVAKDKLEEELKLCVLLCESCHRKEHLSKHPCGTVHKYWRGCRCAPCTLANRIHNRNYRRARSLTGKATLS